MCIRDRIFFFVVLSWHKCYDFSFIHQTSSLECKKQKHYCFPKMQPQQWAKFDTLLTHSGSVAVERCSVDWTQPSTCISQPIVIACPQQAWNNHWIVACAGQTICLVFVGWIYYFMLCFSVVFVNASAKSVHSMFGKIVKWQNRKNKQKLVSSK